MAARRTHLKAISTALEQYDSEQFDGETSIGDSIPLKNHADHSDHEASEDESFINRNSSKENARAWMKTGRKSSCKVIIVKETLSLQTLKTTT